MKKAIVDYSSISGFTKNYAEWIGEGWGANVLSLR